MSSETEVFAYMMAAEKLGNLLFTIEHTMEFIQEYKIKPDNEVKKALIPLLDQMNQWIKD